MTTERPRPVTGVARGSIGTGTALDDTQVYQVSDLAPPAPPPVRVEAPRPRSPERGRRAIRRRSGFGAGTPGLGWIAGTAVVALVVTGIVSSGLGAGRPGGGVQSGAPAAIVPASPAPSAAPTGATGGGGNGHGNGNGNGNGNGGGGGH